MKKRISILLAILPILSFGNNYELMFNRANKFFQHKQYEKAIVVYDSVIRSGHESPAVYYNKGNAYFKLQKYAWAILSYEKAKVLTGNKDDIDFNLRYANLFITDKIEPIPELFIFRFWNDLVNLNSSTEWAVYCIVFLWLTIILLSVMFYFRNILLKKIGLGLSVLVFLIFLFSFIFAWQRYRIENMHNYAIVMTPTTSVKSAPDDESKEIFVIHEGIKVRLYEKVQSWQKIRLADGKTGWIRIDDLALI